MTTTKCSPKCAIRGSRSKEHSHQGTDFDDRWLSGRNARRISTAVSMCSLDVVLIDRAVNPSAEGFDIAVEPFPVPFQPSSTSRFVRCSGSLRRPSYLEERGTPRHPRELTQHDCLVFLPTGGTWLFESADGIVSVDLRPRMSANDTVVLTAAALEGNGIACCRRTQWPRRVARARSFACSRNSRCRRCG
jgi:DNA-binding transcriptional LysR family regulator